MSFDEKMAMLIQRLPKLADHLQTEEATKNALVMPFIAALGYDVFNPKEVVPEFTADIGTKKGEKVDYVIMKDGEAIILVECKRFNSNLCYENMSQLYRYFSVTKARIAILTNGSTYWFYSDLEEPNKMDNKPFMEFDLKNPNDTVLFEVKKMAKDGFDLDRMLSTANDLKFTSEIKKILAMQYDQPEDEFVRFFFTKVMPGTRFTSVMKDQFSPIVSKALNQFLSDKINDRLRSALNNEKPVQEEPVTDGFGTSAADAPRDEGIITTEDEMDGFHIVRAIAAKEVDPVRVVHRDTKSYMGILLDDNNRKPVCRLWFNARQKYIGLVDQDKNESRIPINSPVDIYLYAEQILSTIKSYTKNGGS
jgi:hypothetical protein